MRTAFCLAVILCIATVAHAAVIGKATVTADRAPIMQGDETLATAKKGDTFDVTKVKGNWFGLDPSQGWIHKSNVRYEPAVSASDPPKELTLDLGGGVTMKSVLIPSGKFMMGSPASEAKREPSETQHEVTITKPFYMGIHEVTVGQFAAFVKETAYQNEAEKEGWAFAWTAAGVEKVNGASWRIPGFPQGETHPVTEVTWNDAVAFCQWLSRKSGRSVRLPTEAEWEYACRAGTSTAYQWGGDPDMGKGWANGADQTAKAQFPNWPVFNWADGYVFTSPVGSFRANAWGLYDMHGNVSEWCADWYDKRYYGSGASVDPLGPVSGEGRVLRGGAWPSIPMLCRSAGRGWFSPQARFNYFGFRCAMTLPSATAAAQPAPAASTAGTPDPSELMERIRVEGIKRAGQAGAKPVIMRTDENDMIILLQGSVFTEEHGRFALKAGDFVVNAGKRPIPVFGTTLKQGEAGIISSNGKCTKVAPVVP
jgi:formylglycine-generating enzyme required for sulfatase activity